ncbi:Long-chain fatty acid transport protein 4 [Lachnellula arida]|uniref:Long-chain fatty acid transport protein 4 n=1 Tax=Lachnellula arida TaxID=1316785 RepID=A0A8T9B1F0_9HELO|nr:Long-chain fatty acid transport protein 4 [Lachnellula arida]
MEPATGALVGAAALAAGAYLNAKLGISPDIQQMRHERAWGERLQSRIASLGDSCSTYHMFDIVDPGLEFLWFEDVHRLAAFLESEGVSKKDHIACFMTNSPEMIVTVLALSKLGAVAGLVNTHLRDDTLLYCMDVSTAQTVISTPDLAEFIPASMKHFSLNLSSFPNEIPAQNTAVTLLSQDNLPNPNIITPGAKATPQDVTILIYTSGTTGKPKACGVRNFLCVVTSTPHSLDVNNPQKYFPLRTYSPLPLFHGTAFFTALCYTLGTSSTLCLARKFSASRFFKDVTESRATRMIYVGELCRYLVHAAPSSYDRAHKCIVANGNGLRGEIWEKFRARYGIPEIREFYRSTEGLAKFDNIGVSAAGAGNVGFAGVVRRFLEQDNFILRIDPETEAPYRDPRTGFCVRAKLGEPGEVVGRVKNRALLTEYLNNESATEEKILFDVFEKGDCFQRMGDLMIHDHTGWVRFHDRMGDSFRWKGENVSAGEVRDHLAKLPGVLDAVVYGQKLASYDGQAGAAAITLDSNADGPFMNSLYTQLQKTGLPGYAMPRLVRITPEIETNATFKKAKGDLLKRSWNANEQGNQDKLYWLNGKSYQPLDGESWGAIEIGKAKL